MIIRFVISLVAVLVRGDVFKDAKLLVLRHENAVLRRQIARLAMSRPTGSGSRRCLDFSRAASGHRCSR
jgi:hypothetical protein